jgi:ribosomal protein L7/L12
LGCVTDGFFVLTNGVGLPEKLEPNEVEFVVALNGQKGIKKKISAIYRYKEIALLSLGESYEAST